MSNEAVEEALNAQTPRLVFDTINEDDIPLFLRKQAPGYKAPAENQAEVIKEPTAIEPKVDPEEPAITQITPAPTESDPSHDGVGYQQPVECETSKDLDDLSVEDLKRQQEELAQKIRDKQEAEKKAVIEQIVNVVNTYNIPIDELVDALGGLKIKRKGVKAVQKYQDPATGQTWSGRGKEPAWIRGKDRKSFLIS